MRKSAVLAITGYILILFSFTFFIPIITGIIYGEESDLLFKAYVIPMIISLCVGSGLWLKTRHRAEELRERDAFVVVGMGWLLFAALGSLPYILSGLGINPLDAYFESMSGLTTTSATILDPGLGDYIDVYPHSILMWRALTTWLGGMGIIVFSVVILARFLEGGMHLFKAEVGGASVTRLRPKLHQTARILWGIYGLFTFVSFILLMIAGLTPFESLTTSFSSLSTGGFSVHSANIGHYNSPVVELIVIAFVIIGSTNFVLHYRLITGKFRDVFRDTELRFFLVWLALASTVSVIALMMDGTLLAGDALRSGIFHSISAGTTSGFSLGGDLAGGPPLLHLLLIFLMLFGGTLGSTAGGLKASRLLILLKNTKNGILKAIHPKAIIPVKLGGKPVPEKVVRRVQLLFFSFILTLAVAMIILTATGETVIDSFSATAACLSNAGLGIFGPDAGFHSLEPLSKITLIFCMWIGRLEIITGFILLAPSTYRP